MRDVEVEALLGLKEIFRRLLRVLLYPQESIN